MNIITTIQTKSCPLYNIRDHEVSKHYDDTETPQEAVPMMRNQKDLSHNS